MTTHDKIGSAIEAVINERESLAHGDHYSMNIDAARADLRRLMDAALVVREMLQDFPAYVFYTVNIAGEMRWRMHTDDDEGITMTGPIVNGLPVLDDAARKALGETQV